MSMQNGVDRTFGGNTDVTVEPPDQNFTKSCERPNAASRASPPGSGSRSGVAPGSHNGSADGSVRAPLKPLFFIAIEDLVTGLSRDAELATNVRHRFAVQQSRHKP
jgi:hypothetical protein